MKLSPLQLAIITSKIEEIKLICGEEDYQLLADMLSGETEFDEVLENVTKSIVELEAEKDMKKELAKTYSDSAKSKENAAKSQRSLALQLLEAAGIDKHKTPHGNLSILKGRQSIIIDETFIYSDEYYDKVLNTSKIKDELKNGKSFEGITYVTGSNSIMLRK